MSALRFNSVLLEISSQLSAEQLAGMKFLCRDWVGKRELEKIGTGTQLFQVLTERGKLGADSTDCLSQLLRDIKRPDLSDTLDRFESGDTDNQPDEAERAKLDIATAVIAANLGRAWRKLGRKLGLKDVKLESISKKHPTDLEETAVELLKEWRKSQGAGARTEELLKALRACQLNLMADNVEDSLPTLRS
ncbi:FAS-associated death domain protein [Enoplosus armatus]|uniref:FAS-associated death domain protein n=1 Tax=Enoplosus armatus TaxID=215367 RepID=UPI003992643F